MTRGILGGGMWGASLHFALTYPSSSTAFAGALWACETASGGPEVTQDQQIVDGHGQEKR